MPNALLGHLKVLISADSAQITSDMGKVRGVVRESVGTMQVNAERGMRSLTTEMGKVGGAVKGAQQATAAAMQGLRLMGDQGSAAVAGIGNAVSSLLAGGFTPLGLAIAGATAALALLSSRQKEVVSAFAATEERAKSTADAIARLRLESSLLSRGRGTGSLDLEIAGTEEEAQRRAAVLRETLASGGSAWGRLRSGFLGGQGNDIDRAARSLDDQLAHLGALYDQERLVAEVASKRRKDEDATARALREQSEAAARAAAAAKAEWDALLGASKERAGLTKSLEESRFGLDMLRNPEADPAIERQRRVVQELSDKLARVEQNGGVDTQTLEDLQVRLDYARKQLAIAEEVHRVKAQIADDELDAAAAARVAALQAENQLAALSGVDRAVAENNRARDATLASPEFSGLQEDDARRLAVVSAYAEKEQRIRADFAARAAADQQRADDQRAGETEKVAQQVLAAEQALAFDLDQLDRDETERRVAEVAHRYEQILEQAKEHGISTVELEKKIAAEQAAVRKEAAAKPAETKPVAHSEFELAGAQMAAGGLASALRSIADGSRSASQAFSEFARNFLLDISEMIARAYIYKAVMAGLDAIGGGGGAASSMASAAASATAAASASAAGGAHGGTWRVGGFGGLDSQLVRMKLSPGELVKVSNGANSGAGGEGGGFYGTLVVRPPAVIADEVMAKSSPEARAAVVASALRRPGRRGTRAGG